MKTNTDKIRNFLKNRIPLLYSIYIKYRTNKILYNVFKTNYKKNALICYMTRPFYKKQRNTHTNLSECYEIAKEFKRREFNCDIINYNSTKKIFYEKYDIVFGFGKPFKESFKINKKIYRIFYGTGKHPTYQNKATIKRGLSFLKKNDFLPIESLRLVEEDYLLETNTSDVLVLLGGEDIKNNYIKHTNNQPIYTLNTSFNKKYNYKEIIKNKNFTLARKNFLFFSGTGMIHKGLDLLLDIFSKREDINLHICINTDGEKDFILKYQKELFSTPNIILHNFVDIDSKKFISLLNKCCFVVLPSCSETIPTSVINVAGNGGLIPILTQPASINADKLCIMIENINKNSIEKKLKEIEIYTNDELQTKSILIAKTINKNYSIEKFRENLRNIFDKII